VGLTIGVGWMARSAGEEDPEELASWRETFDALNAVLAEAGMAPHDEPLEVAGEHIVEHQMWGYRGLHTVRRLAAYIACEDRLPSPARRDDPDDDALTERLTQAHMDWLNGKQPTFRDRLFGRKVRPPRFGHLLLHSDCVGFYLPRDFDPVVFDGGNPPRLEVGGMIGSAPRLLIECIELAEMIGLPPDLDPEDPAMWEYADTPATVGETWQVYGTEAFGLARLISVCRASVASGGVVLFG